jgi:hypothetical protein
MPEAEAKLPNPEYWKLQLNKLQIVIDSANENGLFDDKPDTYNKFIEEIIAAIKGLSKKKPETFEARKTWSFVTSEFNRLVNSTTKFRWRFKYIYGGPAFVYLIAFLSTLLAVWFLFWPSLLNYDIFWVPASAFLWGAVGGILWGFWRLWQHANAREIRKAWYNWYITLPLMGSILGALIYLMLLAGLLAITGDVQIQSQFLPMLLSGLAGFSSRWAVEQLENLTKMIRIKG